MKCQTRINSLPLFHSMAMGKYMTHYCNNNPQLWLRGMLYATIIILQGFIMTNPTFVVNGNSNSPSCRVKSRPFKEGSIPTNKISTTSTIANNNLVAMNIGSSVQQQQPYPYKDEDFVIPTITQQPRYIQRYAKQQRSQQQPQQQQQQQQQVPMITASPTNIVVIGLVIASFSKALFRKLWTTTITASGTENDSSTQQLLDEQEMTELEYDDVLDIDGSVGSMEENISVSSSSVDVVNTDTDITASPEWEEKYNHLILEATSLREQLSTIQQMLEQQPQSEQSVVTATMPMSTVVEDEEVGEEGTENSVDTTTSEIQSLNELIQYWKHVAQMNADKVDDVIAMERQNSIQQLNQCKNEMLQMVDQERMTMATEFAAMIQEIRDSLHN